MKNCFDSRYKVCVAQVILELMAIFFPALASMVLGKQTCTKLVLRLVIHVPFLHHPGNKIPLVLCVRFACPQLLRTFATQTAL